ncbi:hypothetical protein BC826DRAFT_998544, partial [Russula brevipes]
MIHPVRLGQTLWMARPSGSHIAGRSSTSRRSFSFKRPFATARRLSLVVSSPQHIFNTWSNRTVGSARSRGRCVCTGGLNMATEAREGDSSLLAKGRGARRLRGGVPVAPTTRRVLGRLMGIGNDAVEFELRARFRAAAFFAIFSWASKRFMCVGMGLPTGPSC